jgi:hypothetical protein
MVHYRISISGETKEAMMELAKKDRIQLLNSIISICHIPDTIYTIEAIAVPDEILTMAKNGYSIQILEEVGMRNC